MIEFIVLVTLFKGVTNRIFGGLLANQESIFYLLAIGIFIGVAMFLIEGARRYAGAVFAICIILYAALSLLGPYASSLSQVLAIVIAAVATVFIKVQIIRHTRRQRMHWLLRTALYIA